jgi:hypothetical protein
MTHAEISKKIVTLLEVVKNGGKTEYFNVESIDGETVKIRVSNHSGKKQNNGDTKTLSFVSAYCVQGYQAITCEWLIDEDGYTDTYQSIEEILEWNDVTDC